MKENLLDKSINENENIVFTDNVFDIETNKEIENNSIQKIRKPRRTDEPQVKDELKKTIIDRYFGKIEPGSMRGSILSLSILSAGVGCLSLPQRVGQLSVLLCSIEIILGGIAAAWTLQKLIEAGRKANTSEYSTTITHYLGNKWSVFGNIIIIIYIFGKMIVYQIICKLLLTLIYTSVSNDRSFYI